MKINAIITAGGTSSRFGNKNKLLELINGKEVIKYTVDAFRYSNVDEIIICANLSIMEELKEIFKDYEKVKIIEGGTTRQQSVYNGLLADKCDYVVIHDGARPIISTELINICIEMVKEQKALTVVTKTIDTIKEVENGKIVKTIDRAKLYNTQTPQAFEYDLILEAHKKYEGKNFTDDAGMIEKMKKTVYIIDGSYKNIKITTRSDIALAKIYLEE
ncbi:2-C-methyl-D-erythritol 4-phosphate cytidylyltransferase [Spirochaetes bacterium]|uniref:2-C-methyl-D-erythritol 4-phosphate cytidylyltransferase n=1 Tax=Candidatus Scatousia excrementipullorum TaxID=2840936 RepID=A0A9D9H022_9BACT|nr:2-C-methyl-D-erythritol 4-phosphate cytidylyltransferase [Candidatus Scatousia excrementipullorum]